MKNSEMNFIRYKILSPLGAGRMGLCCSAAMR